MSSLSALMSGSTPVWVSGATYALGDIVQSPAGGYQQFVRVVAGAGATDPASDSTNWKPFGGRAVKSVQRGTVSIAASSSSGTATVTSVDTSKSVLRFLNFTSGWSATVEGFRVPRITLTNATTITATRAYAVTDETVVISWELTEYY